jgi:hypothetical protein
VDLIDACLRRSDQGGTPQQVNQDRNKLAATSLTMAEGKLKADKDYTSELDKQFPTIDKLAQVSKSSDSAF